MIATKQCIKQAALEASGLLLVSYASKVGTKQATRLALLTDARAVNGQGPSLPASSARSTPPLPA